MVEEGGLLVKLTWLLISSISNLFYQGLDIQKIRNKSCTSDDNSRERDDGGVFSNYRIQGAFSCLISFVHVSYIVLNDYRYVDGNWKVTEMQELSELCLIYIMLFILRAGWIWGCRVCAVQRSANRKQIFFESWLMTELTLTACKALGSGTVLGIHQLPAYRNSAAME